MLGLGCILYMLILMQTKESYIFFYPGNRVRYFTPVKQAFGNKRNTDKYAIYFNKKMRGVTTYSLVKS
jgi:hypothetical protein